MIYCLPCSNKQNHIYYLLFTMFKLNKKSLGFIAYCVQMKINKYNMDDI